MFYRCFFDLGSQHVNWCRNSNPYFRLFLSADPSFWSQISRIKAFIQYMEYMEYRAIHVTWIFSEVWKKNIFRHVKKVLHPILLCVSHVISVISQARYSDWSLGEIHQADEWAAAGPFGQLEDLRKTSNQNQINTYHHLLNIQINDT